MREWPWSMKQHHHQRQYNQSDGEEPSYPNHFLLWFSLAGTQVGNHNIPSTDGRPPRLQGVERAAHPVRRPQAARRLGRRGPRIGRAHRGAPSAASFPDGARSFSSSFPDGNARGPLEQR